MLPAALTHERDRFLDALRVQGAAIATVESRAAAVDQLLIFLEQSGVTDVRTVTRETLRAYQTWLQSHPYSPWTVLSRIEGVRRFFGWLEEIDALLVNPCAALVTPKMGDRLPRSVLTPSQAKAVLAVPDTQTKKGLRDRALLEVFYSTGLRLGEVTRLSVHDVDTRTGFVRVTKGKGAKDRVVPLGRKAADYVAEYLKQVRAAWSKDQRDERALWLSWKAPHGPLKDQAIAAIVKDCLRVCGIAHGRAHLWRHTCATHLVASGANIAYVQRLLGHRSLETTQRYTRVALPEVKSTHKTAHPRARSKTKAKAAPVAAPGTIKGHYAAHDF
jgi:integrase/recombinase XerD